MQLRDDPRLGRKARAASELLKSETAIVCALGRALIPENPKLKWEEWTGDHAKIRDLIEATYPDDFHDYNARLFTPGGFWRDIPALDKMIGALALRGLDAAAGIAVMTSRCSFDLVRKAALACLGGLATRSAPIALAIALARRAGLPLACRAAGGIALF